MNEKYKSWKRWLSVVLAFTLLISCAPTDLFATEVHPGGEIEADDLEYMEETVYLEEELQDQEKLFAEYVENMFCSGGVSAISVGENTAGSKLTGDEKKMYDCLADWLKDIAAGKKTSSRVIIGEKEDADYAAEFTVTKDGFSLAAIVCALAVDFPYEMFWYDKTEGCTVSGAIDPQTQQMIYLIFDFAVAKGYASDTDPSVITVTDKVQRAVKEAVSLVEKNKAASDYQKLTAYKKYLCDNVDYNYEAVDQQAAYGDPWQLIWAFDNDPDTKVVCEGYAKAFQYLCDLSNFESDQISCYSVTGYLTSGTGTGGHMWNVVTMEDGYNYLVDVTNIDSGWPLFLRGGTLTSKVLSESGTTEALQGYEFVHSDSKIGFFYDEDNVWGDKILTLAASDYQPVTEYVVTANLTKLSSNGNRTADVGNDYTATLTAEIGYLLPETVTVMIGETALGTSDYTYTDGTITIPKKKITGAITITAAGTLCTHTNLTYTASENVISASCEACQTTSLGTITLNAPVDLSYDENGRSATVVKSADSLPDVTIVYEKQSESGWDSFTGTPTEAGTYRASITLGDAIAHVEFTLQKSQTLDENESTGNGTDTGNGSGTNESNKNEEKSTFDAVTITPGNGTWTDEEGQKTPLFSMAAADYEKLRQVNATVSVSKDDGETWETVAFREKSGDVYQSQKTVQEVAGSLMGSVDFKVQLTADQYNDWTSRNYTAKLSAYATEAAATVSTTDWASAVTIMAPTGYQISKELGSGYAASVAVTKESATTAGSIVHYYLRQDTTGYLTDKKTMTVKVDQTAPQFTGESGIKITDRSAWWQELLTTLTFGTYKDQKVTIYATDTLSGVKEYYYYLDRTTNTTAKTADELAKLTFTKSTDGKFGLDTDGNYVIYAYAVDQAGNRSQYISSDGVLIDAAQELGPDTKVEVNGTYTYNGKAIVPVVTVTHGKDILVKNRDYTISCSDKNAGLATATITGIGNYKGSVEKVFEIYKAKVTITVSDKVVKIGSAKPAVTYSISGLAENERLRTEPTLSYDKVPDMSKTGTYLIKASGADAGSNYDIKYINGVLYVIDADKVVMGTKQESLPDKVPESLKNAGYASVDDMKKELTKAAIAGKTGYQKIQHYEVSLKYSLDGGKTWVEASEDNFPVGGIRVKLKYPAGTGKDTHDFTVSHMFTATSAKLGTVAGETEQPEVTKTDDGIEVVLNGFSPVSVAWKEIDGTSENKTSSGSDDTQGGTVQITEEAKKKGSSSSPTTGDRTDTIRYVMTALLTFAVVSGLTASQYKKERKKE